ncbi:succinate dehydrogenase cytochrome b subunit SDH3 NDAI_0E01940 [Naumovozyma dairenensis CBS 421]|uniref:Uncharacterized protein n=1 Tax=Naumovozyma dairenensis (strain ATCC 10597 / BCRC 20456 / CBS 421 / NBRC 0211 / NRRL Y-12639) TaxID=1071378 RepID=G0WB90_NAUDC|nr:hypothetical protein NDAI_0E01940 [Naumovozyma dairenensis CBS 421]CCD25010.1 hypothetical protein NDAI_0E01940 [Naumovozyma dairenensis CBS 421]
MLVRLGLNSNLIKTRTPLSNGGGFNSMMTKLIAPYSQMATARTILLSSSSSSSSSIPILMKNTASRTTLQNMMTIRSFTQNSILNENVPSSKDTQDSTILREQRAKRPISPHLTIYQPQLTWYLSSLHRVTLVLMGFAFYLVTIAFGLTGLFQSNNSENKLTSNSLINWYHNKMSNMTKWTVKGAFAYMFTLHYALSVRHLIWDMAKELSLKGVYRTGYAAMGFAALVGTWLFSL